MIANRETRISDGTVLDRRRDVLSRAKRMGYTIRFEPIGGGSRWCEIAGRIHLFVDLTETASQQIASVTEILQKGPGA
ncbi:MAG: hypothetical protein AAF958_12680 [Planctomycetota bacterium]